MTVLSRLSCVGLVAAAPLLAAAEAAAARQASPGVVPARQSWTADRRAFRAGDVITVLIDEYTLASAASGEAAHESRSRGAAVGAAHEITSVGTGTGAVRYGSGTTADSRTRGDATRQNRVRGEMTVRILDLEPNGLLRIEGRKVIELDGRRQEISLRGYVRPEDVSAHNVIESWRVADAEVIYTTAGEPLGRPRQSFFSRFIGWIWP